MSEENVEIVRRAYDAFYSGDAEVALDHFDPDVVVDASRTQPGIGIGHGREQVRRFVTSWVATWDNFMKRSWRCVTWAAGSSSSACSTGGAREVGLQW
jgi:hypothetical protein